jgi:hypothetical protein
MGEIGTALRQRIDAQELGVSGRKLGFQLLKNKHR